MSAKKVQKLLIIFISKFYSIVVFRHYGGISHISFRFNLFHSPGIVTQRIDAPYALVSQRMVDPE